MANIDGRNMYLYLSNNKRTIGNIVVFMTIYICTINFFLLFDNTTGMTHLKITRIEKQVFCLITLPVVQII